MSIGHFAEVLDINPCPIPLQDVQWTFECPLDISVRPLDEWTSECPLDICYIVMKLEHLTSSVEL